MMNGNYCKWKRMALLGHRSYGGLLPPGVIGCERQGGGVNLLAQRWSGFQLILLMNMRLPSSNYYLLRIHDNFNNFFYGGGGGGVKSYGHWSILKFIITIMFNHDQS